MSMSLEKYTIRDLNIFKHITQEFEAKGITDVSIIRQRIQEFHEKKSVERRAGIPYSRIHPRGEVFSICPSCGKKLFKESVVDKTPVMWCKGCTYSEPIQRGR